MKKTVHLDFLNRYRDPENIIYIDILDNLNYGMSYTVIQKFNLYLNHNIFAKIKACFDGLISSEQNMFIRRIRRREPFYWASFNALSFQWVNSKAEKIYDAHLTKCGKLCGGVFKEKKNVHTFQSILCMSVFV